MAYINASTSRISYFDTVNQNKYDNYESFTTLSAFPVAPTTIDRLFFAEDTGDYYRWNGSAYILVVNTSAVTSVVAGTNINVTGTTTVTVSTVNNPTFSSANVTSAPTTGNNATNKTYVDGLHALDVLSVTAGSSKITIGGTSQNPTVDVNEANVQSALVTNAANGLLQLNGSNQVPTSYLPSLSSGNTGLVSITGTAYAPVINGLVGSGESFEYNLGSPATLGNQIGFNASIPGSVTTCNIGFTPLNAADTAQPFMQNLMRQFPFYLYLYDNANPTTAVAGFFINSLAGTAANSYNFNVSNDAPNTTITDLSTISVYRCFITPVSISSVPTTGFNTYTSNIVYVSPNGTDSGTLAGGKGNIFTPFLTPQYAMSQITTNSSTNRFVIQLSSGNFGGSTLLMKPYVYIHGISQSSRITCAISLDATMNTAAGARFGFNNCYCTSNSSLSFTFTNASASHVFESFESQFNIPITIIGASTNDFVTIKNTSIFQNATISSCQTSLYNCNIQANITLDTAGNVNAASTCALLNFVAGSSSNLTVTSTSTYTNVCELISSGFVPSSTLTLNGNGTTLQYDNLPTTVIQTGAPTLTRIIQGPNVTPSSLYLSGAVVVTNTGTLTLNSVTQSGFPYVTSGSTMIIYANVIIDGSLTMNSGSNLIIEGDLLVLGAFSASATSSLGSRNSMMFRGKTASDTFSAAGCTFVSFAEFSIRNYSGSTNIINFDGTTSINATDIIFDSNTVASTYFQTTGTFTLVANTIVFSNNASLGNSGAMTLRINKTTMTCAILRFLSNSNSGNYTILFQDSDAISSDLIDFNNNTCTTPSGITIYLSNSNMTGTRITFNGNSNTTAQDCIFFGNFGGNSNISCHLLELLDNYCGNSGFWAVVNTSGCKIQTEKLILNQAQHNGSSRFEQVQIQTASDLSSQLNTATRVPIYHIYNPNSAVNSGLTQQAYHSVISFGKVGYNDYSTGTTIALTTANTYYQLIPASQTFSQNAGTVLPIDNKFQATGTNGVVQYIGLDSCDVKVTFQATLSVSNFTDIYNWVLYKNGSALTDIYRYNFTGIGVDNTIVINQIITMNNNDTISIYVTDTTTSATSVNINNFTLRLETMVSN